MVLVSSLGWAPPVACSWVARLPGGGVLLSVAWLSDLVGLCGAWESGPALAVTWGALTAALAGGWKALHPPSASRPRARASRLLRGRRARVGTAGVWADRRDEFIGAW